MLYILLLVYCEFVLPNGLTTSTIKTWFFFYNSAKLCLHQLFDLEYIYILFICLLLFIEKFIKSISEQI